MILGPLSKESSTPLLIAAKPVQRVAEYKLLGVTVNTILKWDDHISTITSKATKRLWFLRKLKRAGVDKQYLLYFFLTVIRPVLEYMPVRPGTPVLPSNRLHRWKTFNAAHYRLLPATSHKAKHVLCLNCLRCLKDEIACVVNCLGR